MKANAQKERPVRLPEVELRKSRAGKLGRFPSEDLYEPEQEDTGACKAPSLRETGLSGKREKSHG